MDSGSAASALADGKFEPFRGSQLSCPPFDTLESTLKAGESQQPRISKVPKTSEISGEKGRQRNSERLPQQWTAEPQFEWLPFSHCFLPRYSLILSSLCRSQFSESQGWCL